MESEPGRGTTVTWRWERRDPRASIADDHAVVRAGLAQLLDTAGDVELVGTAANGDEALEVCRRERPDVVLMDLSMPELDGVGATRRLSAAHPEIRVVVLTSFSDRERILDALDAGATGYLLKDAEPDELAGRRRAPRPGASPRWRRGRRARCCARAPSAAAPTSSPSASSTCSRWSAPGCRTS